MSKTINLSPLQMAVMRVLWSQDEASASDVHSAMSQSRELAYTTVATILSRMQKRGLLSSRKAGRQYLYQAIVAESEVRESMVADLVDTVFRGDSAALITHLLTPDQLKQGDLEKIKDLIARAESRQREGGGE